MAGAVIPRAYHLTSPRSPAFPRELGRVQSSLLSRRLRGGQGGIRTRETLLTSTHFPGVRLQPLGHLSARGLALGGGEGFDKPPDRNVTV